MSRDRAPVTPAVRALRQAGVDFTPHCYPYVPRGGTRASSESLGVDEHAVVKTLVFEDDGKRPLVVLMHGDREVSAKELARQIGVRRVAPCAVDVAERHSGYKVGGTSPFGTRKKMPVYMQATIGELERVYVNGGSRGFLVEVAPAVIERLLAPTLVDVDTGRQR